MPSNLSPAFDLITMALANTDDPEHAWIKETWRDKDPRVPVVSLVMEEN